MEVPAHLSVLVYQEKEKVIICVKWHPREYPSETSSSKPKMTFGHELFSILSSSFICFVGREIKYTRQRNVHFTRDIPPILSTLIRLYFCFFCFAYTFLPLLCVTNNVPVCCWFAWCACVRKNHMCAAIFYTQTHTHRETNRMLFLLMSINKQI